jgi:hypothetical protein
MWICAVVVIGLTHSIVNGQSVIRDYIYSKEPVVYNNANFMLMPFEVIEGTKEIRISKANLVAENVLDWGLEDPLGVRGWSGGAAADIIIAEFAASFSYAADGKPLPLGTWNVIIGKARLDIPPGYFDLNITLYSEPSLAPQYEREPYVPPAPLSNIPRFYAGDFHVHSHNSDGGGATMMSLEQIGNFGQSVGLDFVLITDHNTEAPYYFFNHAQRKFDSFLFLPGNEFTTYSGHFNSIGSTRYVDHKVGFSTTINEAASRYKEQGAAISINHIEIDYGFVQDCIGCAWEYQRTLPMEEIDAMEVDGYSCSMG